MWFDKQLMFSEKQSLIAASSSRITSTNVIDLSEIKRGEGEPIEVFCALTTAIGLTRHATTTATLRVRLITADAAAMTNFSTLADTGAVLRIADSTDSVTSWTRAGDGIPVRALPDNAKRYLAFVYNIGAGMDVTAGAISAGLTRHKQSN